MNADLSEDRRYVRLITGQHELMLTRRGSSVYATSGWHREEHDLPYEINSQWFLSEKSIPSHRHSREDLLYDLMRVTEGHFYHWVEVRDTSPSFSGLRLGRTYEWRFSTLLASKQDALIARLTLVY